MSLLNAALKIHATVLAKAAGEEVTYKRGTTSVTLTAVVGESVFDELESDGSIRAGTKTVDFIIQPDALSDLPEPARGDQIVRASGDIFDAFPGVSGGVWEWSDSRLTHYRIHTVKR